MSLELKTVELSTDALLISPLAKLLAGSIAAVAAAFCWQEIVWVIATKGVADGLRVVGLFGAGFCRD